MLQIFMTVSSLKSTHIKVERFCYFKGTNEELLELSKWYLSVLCWSSSLQKFDFVRHAAWLLINSMQ